jgi:hypothetical protein
MEHRYTRTVRVLVNFMERDGWSIHCLAEDAGTVLTKMDKRVQRGNDVATLSTVWRHGGRHRHVERDIARLPWQRVAL